MSDDGMLKWQSLVDRQIRQAQDEGRLDDGQRAGQPLKLDENPYTPADQRMAHKVLKDNHFAPEWIAQRQQIEAQEADLLRQVDRAVRGYRDALAAAITDPAGEARRLRARAAWDAARQRLDEAAARLNREIVSYNLKVPAGMGQRPLFDLARVVERLLRA